MIERLTINTINNYNIIGLKEICRYNRDIMSSYNCLNVKDLRKYIISIINTDVIIRVPPFIYNNKRCIYL
jgi:hypothetical protein